VFSKQGFEAENRRYDLIGWQFLSQTGMVYWLLKIVFTREFESKLRGKVVKMLLDYIELVKDADLVAHVGSIMPTQWFTHIRCTSNQCTSEREMVAQFISHFDANNYENVFFLWDTQARNEAQIILDETLSRLENQLQTINSTE
jgi:hypothetical protein